MSAVPRFYFRRGRWHVTADGPVLAAAWWAAIKEVKCLNHKLRIAEAAKSIERKGL